MNKGKRLKIHGERHHSAKWSDDVVREARMMARKGVGKTAISKAICVPAGTLSGWLYGTDRAGDVPAPVDAKQWGFL